MLIKKAKPSRYNRNYIIDEVFENSRYSWIARDIIKMLSMQNDKFSDEWKPFSVKDYIDFQKEVRKRSIDYYDIWDLDNFAKKGYLDKLGKKKTHIPIDQLYMPNDKFLEAIQRFIIKPPYNLAEVINSVQTYKQKNK